jgi:predicted RNase H-like HicB family nuclease
VVVERNEDAFFAYIPVVPGCTAGGWDYDEVKQNIQEVLDICMKEDRDLRKRFTSGYALRFKVDLESVFKLIPEINISILAARAKMNPALLRQYASGSKKASEKQAEKINEAIGSLAQKLSSLRLTA